MIKIDIEKIECAFSGIYLIRNIKKKKNWWFPPEWSDEMKTDFLNKEVVPYVSE